MDCPVLKYLRILDEPCPLRDCKHHFLYDGLELNNPVETDVVKDYYGCMRLVNRTFTLEEIGYMWGLTRERIRQIEEKVLDRLSNGKRKKIKEIKKELEVFLYD